MKNIAVLTMEYRSDISRLIPDSTLLMQGKIWDEHRKLEAVVKDSEESWVVALGVSDVIYEWDV